MQASSKTRYSTVGLSIHWLTAILVLAAFTLGLGGHPLTLLGDAILWLAGMHAAAAIYHHLVLKDGVLASMLPPWRWLARR